MSEKLDLVQVINDGFTAGIQEVGELFEAKKLYLPHIMAAANAMNAGVDILTPEIEKSGANTGEGLGKFVICTIEGDIHSIGKDIVAIMLKVAGFDVVNLGRDIALKDIVAACKAEKPIAVGTSALMTSTMVNQKTLEELLKEEGIRGDLITNVGGAHPPPSSGPTRSEPMCTPRTPWTASPNSRRRSPSEHNLKLKSLNLGPSGPYQFPFVAAASRGYERRNGNGIY